MKRRGSALLIVLGMLSFMVVSAVSFAIFMRQGRVPSSYLRRSSSSRYLLKAALANAVSRIDGQFASERQIWGGENDSATSGYCEGVYDDPYPGVGPVAQGQPGDDNSGRNYNGDLWLKRVFTPFGSISPDDTVATLTLEALAYLPPAIINEVRIGSRRTRTARWRNLSYDAGRYAFTAVDVSDCFDINRLLAGERRTSAANQRVNLSSLFPQNGTALDDILTRWESSEIPFVSVADFNVMAENSPFAPFYRYVNTSGEAIYQRGDAQSVSNALFITDAWFPPSNTVAGVTVKRYNLEAGRQNQPFNAPLTRPSNARGVINKCTSGLGDVLQGQLGFIGLSCLYDYLDKDSRPLSFCLPCTETAAMVCGLGLAHNQRMSPLVAANAQGRLTGTFQKTVGGVVQTWTRTATPYRLTTFFKDMSLNGIAAFPFKRAGTKGYNAKFKGEALVKVFMGPKSMRCRLPGDSPLYPEDNWRDSEADGVVTRRCQINSFTFDNDIRTSVKALKFFDCQVNGATGLDWPVYWEVKEEVDTSSLPPDAAVPPPVTYYSMDGVKTAPNAFKPHEADGRVANWWNNIPNCSDTMPQVTGGVWADRPNDHTAILNGRNEEYVPHVLVWVRLIADGGDDSGETVDVVPARPEDDKFWGNFDISAVAGQMGGAIGDDTTPVLGFRGDVDKAFTYRPGLLSSPVPHTFASWDKLYAVDPRYNFAPENWFASQSGNAAGGEVTEQEWIDNVCAAGGPLGAGGRDRDIFMFTSDQEYLQSIGELAFLPSVEDLNAGMDFFAGTYANAVALTENNAPDFANRVMARPPANLSGFACREFMWRTYTAYNQGDGIDPIYELRDGATPVEVTAGSGDFRVNPFSPDTRVLMAAMKDTPFDYYAASTNDTAQAGRRNLASLTDPNDRNRFAFCPNSSVARLDDDELEDIAGEMRDKFNAWARNGNGDWMSAFRDLRWYDTTSRLNDEQKTIFGFSEDLQEPLHGVDRKYLYSFWRECFQNRQQLFLVFIRAEPLTVGGMGEGSLASAQLGARGVALVWRDPAPPARPGANRPNRDSLRNANSFYNSDNFAPHRTRVLFYHQFD